MAFGDKIHAGGPENIGGYTPHQMRLHHKDTKETKTQRWKSPRVQEEAPGRHFSNRRFQGAKLFFRFKSPGGKAHNVLNDSPAKSWTLGALKSKKETWRLETFGC
jgi:hypothetical protein